jgi:hypothetical protein
VDSVGRSGGQRIKLVCGRRSLPVGAVKLTLLDHVDSLNTGQQNARTTKSLEAEHGSDDALDGPMILLNDVVQILHLTQLDQRAGISLNAVDSGDVGATLVDGDLVRQAVLADGAFQETACCGQIAFGRKQEVDGGAVTVDGAIEILLLSCDQHIGLIHPPAITNRALAAERHGQHGQNLQRPAMDGFVINEYAALVINSSMCRRLSG